jgi:predicted nucleic acid-binding protein
VLAVLDAGAMAAAADGHDPDHDAVMAVLTRTDLSFVIPVMAIAEATYLIGRDLGAWAEARFLSSMADQVVEAPMQEDWARISELVHQYRNFPLGGTDASVIALAERLDTDLIITLDRRHFAAVRPRHVPAFRILPE